MRAFVVVNQQGARLAADASSARWKAGQPLSPIDGMPIGIKDLLETRDMPTDYGCAAYRGNQTHRDNAAVWALREAGAVILGKTVTAELGGSHPGPTTNPFDPTRTPGGSSSGSAAAVAARMCSAALGTQTAGSVIRPAAYCGNFALKPTQGAINRGERQATSVGTTGVHAGSLEDLWQVAIAIAQRAGGDPGHPGLIGPALAPEPVKPQRLIVIESDGWLAADSLTRAAFEAVLDELACAGVALLRRRDHPSIEVFERSIVNANDMALTLSAWENRWAQSAIVENHLDRVSERLKASLRRAAALTPEHYRAMLRQRAAAQQCHAAIAAIADGVLMLSCPGPAPPWTGDRPGEALARRPTGDPVCNTPSSMLHAPALTLPLMGVGGMPVGVQLMGQRQDDVSITAWARWMRRELGAVTV